MDTYAEHHGLFDFIVIGLDIIEPPDVCSFAPPPFKSPIDKTDSSKQ